MDEKICNNNNSNSNFNNRNSEKVKVIFFFLFHLAHFYSSINLAFKDRKSITQKYFSLLSLTDFADGTSLIGDL